MNRNQECLSLRAMVLGAVLLTAGCEPELVRHYGFAEKLIFPLPAEKWEDVTDDYERILTFDCSFEAYAAWLVQLEEYREMVGMEFMDDPGKHPAQIIAYLSQKIPGDDYQGAYVGVEWIQDDADPPFAIQIRSHVSQPKVVSVKILCSYL